MPNPVYTKKNNFRDFLLFSIAEQQKGMLLTELQKKLCAIITNSPFFKKPLADLTVLDTYPHRNSTDKGASILFKKSPPPILSAPIGYQMQLFYDGITINNSDDQSGGGGVEPCFKASVGLLPAGTGQVTDLLRLMRVKHRQQDLRTLNLFIPQKPPEPVYPRLVFSMMGKEMVVSNAKLSKVIFPGDQIILTLDPYEEDDGMSDDLLKIQDACLDATYKTIGEMVVYGLANGFGVYSPFGISDLISGVSDSLTLLWQSKTFNKDDNFNRVTQLLTYDQITSGSFTFNLNTYEIDDSAIQWNLQFHCESQTANVLFRDTFTQGIMNWKSWHNCAADTNYSVTQYCTSPGSYQSSESIVSMRMKTTTFTAGNYAGLWVLSQPIKLTDKRHLSLFARISSGSNVGTLQLVFNDASGHEVGVESVEWEKGDFLFRPTPILKVDAPSNAVVVFIRLGLCSPNSYAFIDEVVLVED